MYPKLYTAVFVLLFGEIYAQLEIDTSKPVDLLVKEVFASKANDLNISNVYYNGARSSIASFKNTMIYNNMISEGIVISTGNVFDAIGPNNLPNQGSQSLASSDYDLSAIGDGDSYDAAILGFDFVPVGDSVVFKFFFASEEYPEYVNKNVNDVFAFFLISKEQGLLKNLAKLPFLDAPISIDNINATTNSEYFIENGIWESENLNKWKENKALGELAYNFQFDGLTTLIRVSSEVIPGKKYHLKIAISDIGDRQFDSAIFLAAGSLKGSSSFEEGDQSEKAILSEFGDESVVISNIGISVNLKIEFEFNSAEISGEKSYKLLDKVYELLVREKSLSLEVNGHTDDVGDDEYNKKLSTYRALSVAEYLINKGIYSDRIKHWGYGDTKPISTSDKSLNRRVEFVFR